MILTCTLISCLPQNAHLFTLRLSLTCTPPKQKLSERNLLIKKSLFSLDEIMDAKVLVVFLIVLVLALCAARKGRYLNID